MAVEEWRAGGRDRLRSPWWVAFAGAVAARLLYWAVVTPDWVPVADAHQYVELARALAAGDGFAMVFPGLEVHPTAFRPPLLPVVLAPGAWLFGEALWPARLVSVVLGAAVAVQAGQLAARWGGARAGWVAAGAVAVYPPLLANDTVTLSEPLALVLVLWALLSLDARRWFPAALATGLLLLTRPNGYLTAAVLAVFVLRWLGRRRAVGFVAVVVLCVAPWLIRNHVQVGTFRLVTSDGFTLAAVYSPQAQARGTFVDPVFDSSFDDPRFRWAQLDEAVWNRELIEVAREGLRQHPGAVLRTAARNVSGFFELDPDANRWAEENDGRDWAFRSASLPLYWLVTAAGGLGLLRHAGDRRTWPLLLVVGGYVGVSLLLVAPPRLRAPLDLACCIGVGLLAARWRTGRPASTSDQVSTAPMSHAPD